MAGAALRGTDGDAGGGRARARRAVRGGGVLAAAVLVGAATVLPAAADPGAAAGVAEGVATVPGITQRVSYGPGGSPLDAPSRGGGVSRDGRFVLFFSAADDLVPGDTNGIGDGFVRDTWTGRVQRVTLGDRGRQLTADGFRSASLSADGRYVAFDSAEPGLVDEDTDDRSDIFVFDRLTGRTVRATSGPEGGGSDPAISGDGRYVAYSSSHRLPELPGGGTARQRIFVLDRTTGVTRLASRGADGSVGNQPSRAASISDDGQRVAFISRATNLVGGEEEEPEDGTGEEAGGDAREGGPSILKPRLYPLFVYDLRTDRVVGGSVGPERLLGVSDGRITPDGRNVAFIGWEIDRRPEAPSGGLLPHRYIAYVHDLRSGRTTQVGLTADGEDANGQDTWITTSGDGRWVYFGSSSDGLVPGDTDRRYDLFRHDLRTGRTGMLFDLDGDARNEVGAVTGVDRLGTTLVVTGPDGAFGHPGDTNGYDDVFVRRVLPW
ncbi:TolB family protein [Streptomyces sp. SHP 1-2]|uniref:TolB family protein n=1 Tax=Streptomyces sp. SHP 1-2 TaxID=2769489 RepID=UPI0022388642|nr:hypothetical protein [Streptomyces sp. SHP 1-2]MCW5253798.1 PD40 domain-containing protein [Streptomyces sp. SHP 1-2]